ncbi:hypothetical protein D3C86_1431090 [compost metagenome]
MFSFRKCQFDETVFITDRIFFRFSVNFHLDNCRMLIEHQEIGVINYLENEFGTVFMNSRGNTVFADPNRRTGFAQD